MHDSSKTLLKRVCPTLFLHVDVVLLVAGARFLFPTVAPRPRLRLTVYFVRPLFSCFSVFDTALLRFNGSRVRRGGHSRRTRLRFSSWARHAFL